MAETAQGRVIAGRSDAESIAIEVLHFIVADIDRTIRFLNITGLQPETVRESAKSAHFLLGVLDYATKDEDLLKAIERELGIRPAVILVAAVHLAPSKEGEVGPAEKADRSTPQLPRRSLFQ